MCKTDEWKDAMADEFALAFLMPEKEYAKVLKEHTRDSIVDTAAIARHFHVTLTDAANRGVQLGYLEKW